MTINSDQKGKSAQEIARKRRQTAVWFGVIGITFVVILGILLVNSKALEIVGIGILLVLVLIRVAPGFINKQAGKKVKEEEGVPGEQEVAKDKQNQHRE
jgi:ABC-type bacteriocin/lantibiotic exporter with double-glycine peptidase domain